MSGCRFENIHAFATQFVECDLSHAAFSGTCEQSTFKDCMLDHSLLAFSVNKNNTIATCAMNGAVIRQDLEQLTLFRLDLRHCKFDSKNMPQTVFFESQAAGLTLQHRNLTGTQFIDADFSGALFDQSTLAQCSLKGCALHAASFNGVDAPCALFPESDLTEALFHDANLAQTIWVEAVLQRTDFSNAILTMSVFQR